jgi:ABC-type molybdate transport system substrate-binding protein
LLAGASHADSAAFLAFLRSDEARRIFEKHGFGIAR